MSYIVRFKIQWKKDYTDILFSNDFDAGRYYNRLLGTTYVSNVSYFYVLKDGYYGSLIRSNFNKNSAMSYTDLLLLLRLLNRFFDNYSKDIDPDTCITMHDLVQAKIGALPKEN